jgi:hypothetical protein
VQVYDAYAPAIIFAMTVSKGNNNTDSLSKYLSLLERINLQLCKHAYILVLFVSQLYMSNVRSPYLYVGLELMMYEGIDTDLEIWIIPE